MDVATVIAGCVTALATAVLAWAAWLQLPLIAEQVKGLAEQLRLSREAEEHTERRTREWETLKACQRYDFDPVIEGASKRLWAASDSGKHYANPDVDQRDMMIILNYLDGIAIGVGQGLYIDPMVKDHLGPVFDHVVTKYIDTGIIDRLGCEATVALHAQWYRGAPITSYLSSGAKPSA